MQHRSHMPVLFLSACVALVHAPLQGGETSSSVPVLLPYESGPGGSSRVCDGGDRNGLFCSVCDGGERDGEPCHADGFCPAGNCTPRNDLCPGQKPDGAPASCSMPGPWLAARFLPVRIDGGVDSPEFAIRVVLQRVPSNPHIEGQVRWVGVPEAFWEGDDQTQSFGTYLAAGTICSPLVIDFSASPEFWVYGEEIHHESIYALRTADATCVASMQGGGSDECLSPPLFVMTGTCGDAVSPLDALTSLSQPNIHDIHKVIDKFLGYSAPTKPRLLCTDDLIPRLDEKVGMAEILSTIDALFGSPYPLEGTADARRCE